MLEIGKKAKVILDSFVDISPSAVLRGDYLYAKADVSPGENKQKGVVGIVGVYELPSTEVQTDNPIGFYDMSKFLKVLSTFDGETLKLSVPEGLDIVDMKDKNKKIRYEITPIEMLPRRQKQGEELFEAGSRKVVCTLTNETRKAILEDMKTLGLDVVSVVVDEAGKVLFKASTPNFATTVEYAVEESLVMHQTPGFDWQFSNGLAIDTLLSGNYRIDIRECSANGRDFCLCQMTNVDFEANETENGVLKYFLT